MKFQVTRRAALAWHGGRCAGSRPRQTGFRRSAHHQIQPRRVARRPQGQGRAFVQATGRKIHRRQSHRRSLSELLALQGQGRARSPAAQLGASSGAVDLQIRSARRQGIRRLRSAVPDDRRRACAPDDGEPDDGRAQQEARSQGRQAAGLLGQRRARLYRQPAADHARRFPGPENAHPGLESARCGRAPARRHSADHRLRRALSGAADRRRRRRRQCAVQYLDAEILRRAEISHRVASRTARPMR